MAKPREEQTRKERTAQRRKRRKGFFHKAYLLGKLCDVEVGAFVRNPEDGQIHTFRSTSWWPSMTEIQSANPRAENVLPSDFEQPAKGGNRLRPNKTTRKVRSKVAGSNSNVKSARDISALPEPPAFGLTPPTQEEPQNTSREGDRLRQGEITFLEELDLNLIL